MQRTRQNRRNRPASSQKLRTAKVGKADSRQAIENSPARPLWEGRGYKVGCTKYTSDAGESCHCLSDAANDFVCETTLSASVKQCHAGRVSRHCLTAAVERPCSLESVYGSHQAVARRPYTVAAAYC